MHIFSKLIFLCLPLTLIGCGATNEVRTTTPQLTTDISISSTVSQNTTTWKLLRSTPRKVSTVTLCHSTVSECARISIEFNVEGFNQVCHKIPGAGMHIAATEITLFAYCEDGRELTWNPRTRTDFTIKYQVGFELRTFFRHVAPPTEVHASYELLKQFYNDHLHF